MMHAFTLSLSLSHSYLLTPQQSLNASKFPFTPVLASCLTNAQPLPAHRPAADGSSLIGCTSRDLTDDWLQPVPISLTAYAHFAVHLGTYRSTIPLRFIWSIWHGN